MDIIPTQLDMTREVQLQALLPSQESKPTPYTGTVPMVASASIVAGDNDRTSFDQVALRELADSIQAHGLAQPITIRPIGAGTFQIVAGERRFRAMQLLGMDTVPALIRDMDDEQAAAIMLAENVQRVDLNPIDEARAYSKRMAQFGWSIQEVARQAKVPSQRVRGRLALLSLIEDVQLLVKSGQLTIGYAEAMVDLDSNRQIIALRYFSEAKRPSLVEFKRLCGELLAEQAQDALFDFEAFMTKTNYEAPAEGAPISRIPTSKALPQFRGAVSVGRAMEQYIADLVGSGDPEMIAAAEVVGTVYEGLIKANLAKPPKIGAI